LRTTNRDIDVIGVADDGRLLISDVRRGQIIRIVRTLITNEGVPAVTMARIATELGSSRGVVNHHFKNKKEILHEALQGAVRDANRQTNRVLEKAEDISQLTGMVAALTMPDSDWWPIYVAFLAEAGRDEFYRHEIAEADRSHRLHLTAALGTEARAAIALALMKGLALQKMSDPDLDLDQAVQESTKLFENWGPLEPTTVPKKVH
jgi:AcrR family transcriptional regulator